MSDFGTSGIALLAVRAHVVRISLTRKLPRRFQKQTRGASRSTPASLVIHLLFISLYRVYCLLSLLICCSCIYIYIYVCVYSLQRGASRSTPASTVSCPSRPGTAVGARLLLRLYSGFIIRLLVYA